MKIVIHLLLTIFLLACVDSNEPALVKKVEIKVDSSKIENTEIVSRMSKSFIHGIWQNLDHQDIDLILHLNMVDDLVLGEYCSKAKNFFLEDCSLEDEGSYCSIRGPFNQYNTEIDLESCITAEVSEAFLRKKDDKLILILDKPAGMYGEDHLIPDTCTFKKISNDPYHF